MIKVKFIPKKYAPANCKEEDVLVNVDNYEQAELIAKGWLMNKTELYRYYQEVVMINPEIIQ